MKPGNALTKGQKNIGAREMIGLTTSSRVDRNLLDWYLLIQESALAKKGHSLVAIIGDSDFDLRVACSSEFHAQRRLALENIHRSSSGVCGQGSDRHLREDLHVDECM